MDAAGPQRLVVNPAAPLANLSPPIGRGTVSAGDSIAWALGELSQADLTRLLESCDAP
jgi:hypothetical protein